MSNEDIEELKRITEELTTSKQKTESILFTLSEALPIPVMLVRNRVISWVNTAATYTFRTTKEYMVCRNTREFYATNDDYEKVGEVIYKSPQGKEGVFVRFRRKDGETFNGFIRAVHVSPSCDEVLVLILDLYDFRNRCEDLISLTHTGVVYGPPA